MNNVIQDLAKYAAQLKEDMSNNPDAPSYDEIFAELIVRECAEVAHCNFHVDGLTLGGIMKKHFGIEDKNT